MKKIYTAIMCVLAAWTMSSCSDFLSEYSQDMVVAKTVTHMDELLLGDVYLPSSAYIEYGPSGSRVCGFLNILDDDVNTGRGGKTVLEDGTEIRVPFAINVWSFCVKSLFGYFAWQSEVGVNMDGSSIADDNATWNDLYKRINVINVILDEIVDLPRETDEDKAGWYRVQGEAHFLRAQFYFILANLYGDAYEAATCDQKLCVPLKLTPYVEHDHNADTQFQRATVKEVYSQILYDLLIAVDYLSQSPQKEKNRLHRASAEAASLLLSRVALYMQDWELAETAAHFVIESPHNSLATIGLLADEVDFLSETNPEIIFSQGSNNLPMAPRNDNVAFAGICGSFCVSSDLANLYDQVNDRRFDCFFGKMQGSDSLALENKYKARANTRARISDVFTMRVAEAYLNKMEACAMQGGTKESVANSLLNELRKQRIDNYADQTYTGEELVSQIRDERRKELCFEGHRWFDLRRYAVNSSYPYSKSIIHVFNVTNDNGDHQRTRTYRLEEGDMAYTFAIPKKVLEFDKVPMPTNPRESRKSLEEQGIITEPTEP